MSTDNFIGELFNGRISQREFEKLVTAVKLSRNGAFLLALYSSEPFRTLLIEALREQVAPLPVYQFEITPEQPDVYRRVRQLLPDQRNKRGVVCVGELDAVWPESAEWLERNRDKLATYSLTYIFWITDGLRGELAQKAPNFYSRHSGVFDLRLQIAASPEQQALYDLYNALLPEYQQNPLRQAELLTRMGKVAVEARDYQRARPYLEQALSIREEKLGANHPDSQANRKLLQAIQMFID